MVERIVERSHPERVMVFGSFARGEATEDSDVDLLVLFRDLDDRRTTVTELYEAVNGMDLPKDIVAVTIAEFERYRGVANTIYQAADVCGVVVYER
jgi:predicted nucleotidyltransferase